MGEVTGVDPEQPVSAAILVMDFFLLSLPKVGPSWDPRELREGETLPFFLRRSDPAFISVPAG